VTNIKQAKFLHRRGSLYLTYSDGKVVTLNCQYLPEKIKGLINLYEDKEFNKNELAQLNSLDKSAEMVDTPEAIEEEPTKKGFWARLFRL
jgi:hypothetical protein